MSKSRSKRRSSLKKWLSICGLCLIAIMSVFAWYEVQRMAPAPLSAPALVGVEHGESTAIIAEDLFRKGVIRNALAFRIHVKLSGKASRIRAGNYRFTKALSAESALSRLTSGITDPESIRVTIPEGFSLVKIANRLQKQKVITSANEFVTFCKKPVGVVITSSIPEGSLEGYLFPDTYQFRIGLTCQEIIKEMTDNFDRRFASQFAAQIKTSNHSLAEIVTIASLIEREAEVEADRPLIAGVIENRLKLGMKLDIDATVLYALGRHKARVMYSDLKVESPYNTYRHKGLPPGPICSPGLPSLLAALAPAKHRFLFYVAQADGSHKFAQTESEHNKNVAAYRAQRALKSQDAMDAE